MWLQSREVHSGHDLLPLSAAGEVSRAEQPLFLAFVDLTKAFDLVSRSGLFKILQKIGYPSKLLAIITSFHQDMQSTVCFDGATSNAFPVSRGVKQGCVLAPTLFGIFFSMLLQYAFVDFTGVYVWTRSAGKLFNIARLRAKTKAYGAHTKATDCRRRCFNIPLRGGPPTSGRQAVPRLQGVWANDQPQEDQQHPDVRC